MRYIRALLGLWLATAITALLHPPKPSQHPPRLDSDPERKRRAEFIKGNAKQLVRKI